LTKVKWTAAWLRSSLHLSTAAWPGVILSTQERHDNKGAPTPLALDVLSKRTFLAKSHRKIERSRPLIVLEHIEPESMRPKPAERLTCDQSHGLSPKPHSLLSHDEAPQFDAAAGWLDACEDDKAHRASMWTWRLENPVSNRAIAKSLQMPFQWPAKHVRGIVRRRFGRAHKWEICGGG
jgi:hypothetical protein